MKRSLLATTAVISLVLPVLATTSCALDEAPPPPVSSGGKAGSTSSTTGGASGSSTGGNTTMSGTGGMSGSGGSGGSGGATGGTGGATGGSAGTAGTGGSAGGGEVTVDTFAGTPNENGFAFKDSYMMVPCYNVIGVDCIVIVGGNPDACPNTDDADFEARGYVFKESFQMTGAPGTNYDVSIQVNGMAEGKYYSGGTRQRGTDTANNQDQAGTDTFYTGGQADVSWYNVYKITVFQADGVTEVQHYYLNSWPQEFTDAESHRTFPISYAATIEVPGDGVVEYLIGDSNCKAINNCGPGDNGSNCPTPREIPQEPGLAIPASYGGEDSSVLNSVNGTNGPWHAQMIHITVTDVVAK